MLVTLFSTKKARHGGWPNILHCRDSTYQSWA